MDSFPCRAEDRPPLGSLDKHCAECRARRGSLAAGAARDRGVSRSDAHSGFRRVQQIIGISFLLSAVAGVYLLATDGSLWLLAVSHAYGLMAIVVIDSVLGVMNLLGRRSVYLPSLAAAALGFLLQIGDVATAPQYKMTVPYFARYLFGLWAYDLLLALQIAVLLTGILGRTYAAYLARVRVGRRGKPLNYDRRGFVKSFVAFGGVIAAAVLAASVKLPAPQQASQTQTSTSSLPNGAIANVSQLQVGSPFYFEYPTGYPNILLKNSDGSLTALSMLCTHVCCECAYDQPSGQIYCPCHGSVFDSKGNVLRGPAQVPLPSIRVTVDASGLIYAQGLNGTGPCLP